MANKCSSRANKIEVSGIKLSQELIQFNCVQNASEAVCGSEFFRHLAENRINIPFLCTGVTGRGAISCCCVEAGYLQQVQKLLTQNPQMSQHIEKIAPVGTLTLYPHRYNFKLLGFVMAELGKAGFPIYGIGTSISALTFSTNYHVLEQAAGILGKALNLPSNHAPFRSEFRIQQI
jgi:aspartokinase